MTPQGDAIRYISALPQRAARAAEYADLSGEDGRAVYRSAQRDLEAVIREARAAARAIKALAGHVHVWNDDDYCSACGADGRA